ncbi:hypothetical protein Tco_1426829, partial [Tanacetum coccineum]
VPVACITSKDERCSSSSLVMYKDAAAPHLVLQYDAVAPHL